MKEKRMKLLFIIAGVLLLGSAAAFALSDAYVSGIYRYKITINVQTPDGMKSGSAVREVTDTDSDVKVLDLPDVGSAPKIKGEAVVVDLGEKGKLFGLIKDDSYRELFAATPHGTSGASTVEGIKYFKNLPVGNVYELKMKWAWPQMVTFEDLSDPMSVRAVDKEDISETFGPGYAIDSITIEITDERLDCDVLNIVPEFSEEYWEWRKTLKYEDPRKVGGYNFCKGKIR
jgi:hypothetical protein